MLKDLPISSATRNKIAKLFRRYGYGYTFYSSDVADIFGVKPTAATAAPQKLRKLEAIKSPKYGVYKFVKLDSVFSVSSIRGLVLGVGGDRGRRI